MNGPLLALFAIGAALFLSSILFERQGEKSATVSATTGIISNAIWISAAVFIIFSSVTGSQWLRAVAGTLLLTLMLYLARGNYRILKESEVRAKIAGQT